MNFIPAASPCSLWAILKNITNLNSMRKLFFNAFILTILSLKLHSQIPTVGLIAYYPFTGNAGDSSGNTNHGIVYGASLTTDRFGVANRAYSFNGTTNYIRVPNSSTLQASTYQLTISAWIKINQYSGTTNKAACILEKASGSSGDWGIVYQDFDNNPSVEKLRFGGYVWHSSTIATQGYWTTTVPATNQWYLLVYTIDGSSNTNYYINGVNESTISGSFSLWSNNSDMYIGKSATANGTFYGSVGNNYNFFNGSIDDIRIYNRALSESEVLSLYTETSTTTNPTTSNVGINVSNPARDLHVNSVLRLEPRSTAPTNPQKGDIYFDSVINKLRVYDGTTWQNCW